LSSAGTATFGGNITYGLSTAANNTVNRTLQLQATEGTVTFKGAIREGTVGQSTGLLSINKTGAGTVVLSGANTYSGMTSVSAGTLLVNNTSGSGTSSGAVMVAGDATLGGKGTIGGTVTVSGTSGHLSVLNPGDSLHTGTLTINSDVAVGDYGNLVINLNGSSSNALAVNGNINLSSLLDNLTFTGAADGTTHYVIATYTGTLTGTFNSVANLPTGYTVDYNAGQIVLAPEPRSLALLAGVPLAALSSRRRRRRAPLQTA
jgi:fibronectin-binding autotransporter adhesin